MFFFLSLPLLRNVVLSKINYLCSKEDGLTEKFRIVRLVNRCGSRCQSSMYLYSNLTSFTYVFSAYFEKFCESKRWMYVLNRQLYTTDWISCATSRCWMVGWHTERECANRINGGKACTTTTTTTTATTATTTTPTTTTVETLKCENDNTIRHTQATTSRQLMSLQWGATCLRHTYTHARTHTQHT